ncbi:MAG: helix-turn-helix domain-containing protein [Tunicatimonas sp.]|uniref:winged helix-turn-helix transcriptional regulator n=1 Tax=Tunicatimonas sp. TaxID=1940096 RepID=UPI003C7389D1
MKRNKMLSPTCPIRTTLEMLGGKWRLLIINEINSGSIRYGEIKRAIPEISEKMLAQELKTLVDNDLVVRRNYGEVPPRVDYSLTENGKKALQLIEPIRDFGLQYIKQ